MTIREKINKLEVLEDILKTIEAMENSFKEDARTMRDRYEDDGYPYWLEMAEKAEAKADYCYSYRIALTKTENL